MYRIWKYYYKQVYSTKIFIFPAGGEWNLHATAVYVIAATIIVCNKKTDSIRTEGRKAVETLVLGLAGWHRIGCANHAQL